MFGFIPKETYSLPRTCGHLCKQSMTNLGHCRQGVNA